MNNNYIVSMAISSILICDTFFLLGGFVVYLFIYLFYVSTYGLSHFGVLWYNVAKVNTIKIIIFHFVDQGPECRG